MNGVSDPIGENDLQAWVDGRLKGGRLEDVEAWLGRNKAEAARFEAYREQRNSLRSWFATKANEPVPLRLRTSVLLAQQRSVWRRRVGAVAAAVLLTMAGGAGGWIMNDATRGSTQTAAAPADFLVSDAVQAHLTFVSEIRHPVEVPAAQEAHLVGWLSKRLGRPLRVPDLQPLGFRLMGGRLLPGETVPAAQFMYDDDHGTRLTLYMRAERADGTGFEVVEKSGVTGFRWYDAGFGYAVLAETDRVRLLRVAEAVDRQLPAPAPSPGKAAAPL